MPELPEVETVRSGLAPWLTGRLIRAARRADAPPGPKYRDLERADGQHILSVGRRGKFLIAPLSGGDELIIHLGMTGVVSPSPSPRHVRVTVALDGPAPDTLYFIDPRRFGRFLVARGGDRRLLPTLHALGPEPLSPDFTVSGFDGALRSRAPIKAVLLAQRAVAGVGNIYADEALWRARIHPRTRAVNVSWPRLRALHAAIREVLAAAVAQGGTTLSDYRTVDGDTGRYGQALRVYGRTGQPCPRCGTPIRRMVIAQRGTHVCPSCQQTRYRPRPGR